MSDYSFEKYPLKKKSIDHWKYFPSEIDEWSLQQIVGSRLTKIDLAQLVCERWKQIFVIERCSLTSSIGNL